MALYRTIQGPPKETAFTDEQLERYLAEVRRDTLLEAAKLVCNYCKEESEGVKNRELWFDEYRFVHGMDARSDYIGDYYGGYDECDANAIHKLIAAEQDQGEGDK